MKKLVLVRHAKSSWKFPDLRDFDRPLNNRGRRDAPFMGEILFKNGFSTDAIFSSPANRALTTARIIAKKINYPENNIIIDTEIYESSEEDLANLIRNKFKDEWNTVMLFGHNFSLTFFANWFCIPKIENIPTCGIVELNLSINSWSLLVKEDVFNYNFEYPKKYLQS